MLAVGAVTLVTALFGLRACMTKFLAEDCSVELQLAIQSPDQTHEAFVNNKECDGPLATGYHDYFVTIRNGGQSTDAGIKVFVASDVEPDITWRDNNHLIVTIKAPSFIGASLHQANGVTVIYRLADGLLEQDHA
jgi:hypothetical protein